MLQRRIYVISGFDPRSMPYSMRKLNEQLQINGNGLSLELKARGKNHRCWALVNKAREPLGIELVLLQWDDLVREFWTSRGPKLFWDGIWLYARYIGNGTFYRFLTVSKRAGITFAWPLIYWLFWAALMTTTSLTLISLNPGSIAMTLLLIAINGGLLWLGIKEGERRRVNWLLRSLCYTDRIGRNKELTTLNNRLKSYGLLINNIENKAPAKTIQLVGHSCGSFLAVMLAARLRRSVNMKDVMQRLQLLTLGQTISHLAILPYAKNFINDLAAISYYPPLAWDDISSKDDWISFAGTNPLDLANLKKPHDNYPTTTVVPLRHHKAITNTWKLLNNQFSIHFLYFQSYQANQHENHNDFDFINDVLTPTNAR